VLCYHVVDVVLVFGWIVGVVVILGSVILCVMIYHVVMNGVLWCRCGGCGGVM